MIDQRLDQDDRLPRTLAEVATPSLVLDLDVLERNLTRMAERIRDLGVSLRPHFKTHKCPTIADRQSGLGARGFTVATLAEARALIDHGHRDLTWAFPVIPSQIPRLATLLREATLRVLVDSHEAISALEEGLPPSLGPPSLDAVHVWLKIDCGYHRAGVDPASSLVVDLARRLADSKRFVFDGILTHAGQAYALRGRDALRRAAEDERRVMVECAERLCAAGIEVPGVSVGSTPTMSAVEDLTGVTEARPGNYAFYDYSQCEIGSCEPRDCAVTVVASVVSAQPGARHSVLDAGALTLSKDPGPSWVEPPTYGRLFGDYERGELDPELRLTSLSQEHGIVNRTLPVGSRVRVLPNHSCLVVPNFERYVTVRGDEVVGTEAIWGGR